MISNASSTVFASHLPWVDGASIWLFDAIRRTTSSCKVRSLPSLWLYGAGGDYFSVAQLDVNNWTTSITGHAFSDPAKALFEIIAGADKFRISGDPRAIDSLRTCYLVHGVRGSLSLIRLFAHEPFAEIHALEAALPTVYAHDGFSDVVTIPNTDIAIITARTSSVLWIYDLAKRRCLRTVSIGNRGGEPQIQFLDSGRYLVTVDYDTVVKVQVEDWAVVATNRVQDGIPPMDANFAGSLWVDPMERLLLVARPYSNDIVVLKPTTLEITKSLKTLQQPIEVAQLKDGTVISRDWKSGALFLRA